MPNKSEPCLLSPADCNRIYPAAKPQHTAFDPHQQGMTSLDDLPQHELGISPTPAKPKAKPKSKRKKRR